MKIKLWFGNTEDNEKAWSSYDIEYMEDVLDVEDRFTIFAKADLADKEITRQIFAFKFNSCKFKTDAKMRENLLIRILKNEGKYFDDLCPLRKGLKIHVDNETYSDELFPPIPNEVQFRSHKEVFGKLNGMKKWTKLFTQDVYFNIKK
jgi:hypothetical protein